MSERVRRNVEVLVRVLWQVEVGFRIHRVRDARRWLLGWSRLLLRRWWLSRPRRHYYCLLLLCKVETLLKLHILLRLQLLSLLLILRFFGLPCGRVRLREFVRRQLLVPPPLLLQLFVDEADAPAGFLVDLVEDL